MNTNTKIYVGNLLYKISEGQLANIFESFGEIKHLSIITDRETGRSRGFGFIEFADQAAAQAALSMNEKDIEGKKIVVNMAKPQEKKPRGGGGRNGGGGRGGYGNAGRGGFGGGRDHY